MADSDRILPERLIGPDGLLLRRWLPEDADALSAAIAESSEHLQPWMAWVVGEPLTPQERRAMLVGFERDWRDGGDVLLGIFLDGGVVGGCGLHRRIARDGLELGYWLHPHFTGRGLATSAARVLTDASLRLPGITHVEIHHDKANFASAGVPRRLGFWLVDELPDEIEAPAEAGIECEWRMEGDRWASRGMGPSSR
jgi:ribosomal-protein-serine acetyltransferase